ncbi:hypothetical protein AOLI_G00150160 [Acnodon oligacanthus]
MTLISLLLLAAVLPYPGHAASVKVGIINGTEAKPHSRPYMVSLQMDGYHLCGGFLVSDRFVMTAAHCYLNRPRLTAVLGAHDVSNRNEGSIRIEVEAYFPHQQFNSFNADYDIMLLKLRSKVIPNSSISWIPIHQKQEDIPDNTVCSVAGWGRTKAFSSSVNRLMETTTTIIDRRRCAHYWSLTSRMMCAQFPGGSCKGDSGGPLVCDNAAVGIVSFGERRCTSPQFFTGPTFIREGQKKPNHAPAKLEAGQLDMAWDWKMLVDIGQQLIFPPEIAAATLRPDLVLWSPSLKSVYITELTVPWENSAEEVYKRKKLCHTELAADAQQRGWNAKVYLFEVGCRGFVASSTIGLLKDLGIHGQAL